MTKSISLSIETREPTFVDLPAHLDPSVPDDRVLGAALAIQARYSGGVVVLVARDLNLQNKAQVVGLPFVEPPTKANEPS